MPEVIFNGTDGRLECRYHHNETENAPIALLLHPHPRHGGTMNNKVVVTLYQSFIKRGFSTLRFNFRGIGRSQGEFDDGPGELSDAASALDWAQTYNPNAQTCWIAGFSFGAWVAMQLMMRRPEITGFISIAPPADSQDFSFLAPCPASGMILHGDNDEMVPIASVDRLAQKLKKQKNISIDFRPLKNCDHFFQDHITEMNQHVEDYLDKNLILST